MEAGAARSAEASASGIMPGGTPNKIDHSTPFRDLKSLNANSIFDIRNMMLY